MINWKHLVTLYKMRFRALVDTFHDFTQAENHTGIFRPLFRPDLPEIPEHAEIRKTPDKDRNESERNSGRKVRTGLGGWVTGEVAGRR